MHACTPANAQCSSVFEVGCTMAEGSIMDPEWMPDGSYDPYGYAFDPYYQEKPPLGEFLPPHAQQFMPPQQQPQQPPPSPTIAMLLGSPQHQASTPAAPVFHEYPVIPRGDNPREIRNRAEKQRRDKLNHSISELASIVPPVVAANRKIDKTGILRLTAHYLRAHQYVFGDSIGLSPREFNPASAQAVLALLQGFLLTTTYRGLIVVVSQNVQQYLGHAELDLLGQNVYNIIHQDDHAVLKENLTPKSHLLGPNGELLTPDTPDGKHKIMKELAGEKRRFIVRFKKHGQRSEPAQYVSCYVEGTFRKSDKACRGYNRCCQIVRRARARGDNPCSSGNDVVFIGVVRPTTETFMTESNMEAYLMEYRTRHSIDGQIMECEQRISLVAGYMTHEVNGANAMNFMHRDDVRWVVFALREMYSQHRRVGESCYRLMTKNGQFIYLKTVGVLDVDEDSRAARSFVCTNTVVNEQEGKHLIQLMKKKVMMTINNNEVPPREIEDPGDVPEDLAVPVEDPRNIEKVILHLVTNLPSPQTEDSRSIPPDNRYESPIIPLAIIPPRKERILSAIEKIYSVIKSFKREPHAMANLNENKTTLKNSALQTERGSPARSPNRSLVKISQDATIYYKRQMENLGDPNAIPGPLGPSPRPYGTMETIPTCSTVTGSKTKKIILRPVVPQTKYQVPALSGFSNISSVYEESAPLETSPTDEKNMPGPSIAKRLKESSETETDYATQSKKKLPNDDPENEDVEMNILPDINIALLDDPAFQTAIVREIETSFSLPDLLDQEVEGILGSFDEILVEDPKNQKPVNKETYI